MNKKGLSILLALSMVFSLNTFAFAEEAVVEDDAAVVEAVAEEDEAEVTQSQDHTSWTESLNQYSDKTSFKDGAYTISGAGIDVGSYNDGLAYYHGKKITGTDLGLYIQNDSGYRIRVKGIKLTSNKKSDATGEIKFNLKSIGSYKDVISMTHPYELTEYEAKQAYKNLKASLKNAKSTELTAYIAPTYINDSISESALKTLKKAGKTISMGELESLGWVDTSSSDANVFIKAKNGSVKKVQLVYLAKTWIKSNDGGDVYKVKVKTRTLKKGKDYVANGDSITFDNLDTYSGGVIKAKS